MGKTPSASPEQWKELYDVTQNLKMLCPWQCFLSDDLIGIALENPRETVFCSVMGNLGECCGISVFPGASGLYDFERIATLDQGVQSLEYVMQDQTCLTLYWGDRDEVPPDQKKMIKELGLKYRGNGNWPFFLSFKSRYAPCTPDAEQVALLTETFKNLFMVTRAFLEGRITPEWDSGQILMRSYDPESELWLMGWMPKPEVPDSLPEVELTDEVLKARLKKRPRSQARIILDLIYLHTSIVEKRGERPFHPLVLCVLDEQSHTIVRTELLPPDVSEIDAILTAFIDFVLEHGRMKQIRARNPWVFAALTQLCANCGVKLVKDALPEMDEIAEILEQVPVE